MKQSLQLKLGQQLTMTPQLQQAIRLLQMSSLDLQLEIQSVLEANPLLELAEEEYAGEADEIPAEASDAGDSEAEFDDAEPETGEDLSWDDAALPGEIPANDDWDEGYSPPATAGAGDYERPEPAGGQTLQGHMLWQLNLTPMSATDRLIAEAIIDSLEPTGLLGCALSDILAGLPSGIDAEEDEVLAVLHRLQHFEPPGVAARDLPECLLLQLRQLPADTPWRAEAILLIERFLPLLARRDFAALTRRARLSADGLEQTLKLIRSLDPHPGYQLTESQSDYLLPDVIVRRSRGEWRVELNPEIAPRLRINQTYAGLVQRGDRGADNQFIKHNLQEARWFLKSLESRNETLLKVARGIMDFQHDFLERGEEAMKPLVLHDIAELVGMHESTVSRVTTRKYALTPRGLYELKYFFSSHVPTSEGGECSSTAIRAIIKRLVAEENPRKPLSDSRITALLGEQGIKVARRTVAKYRESLGIAASHERKQPG